MTIQEMKNANEAAGKNWFSPGAMGFFKTRLQKGIAPRHLCGALWAFVTSEKPPSGCRGFTVRLFNEDTACVRSLLPLCALDTAAEAVSLLTALQLNPSLSEATLEAVQAFANGTGNLGLGLSTEQKWNLLRLARGIDKVAH